LELGQERYEAALILPVLKVAIVGCGAVGLFYGTRLLQAGADVHFLMRSGLKEARKHGIRVITGGGEEAFHPVRVYQSTAKIGPVDWCIVAIKSTDNPKLPGLVSPILGTQTRLLTLQNGLGNEEWLAKIFPNNPVSGGLCFVCLNRKSPATVHHIGHGTLLLGDHFVAGQSHQSGVSAALQNLSAMWKSAGIEAGTTEVLREARWRKLMWNIPFNGLAIAAGGVGVDRILADPVLSHRARALMEEVRATAEKLGCMIAQDFVDEQFRLTEPMGDYQPSSLLDYLAGRPVEWHAIWKRPLEISRALRVPAPELAKLTEELSKLVKIQ
jgi:2-dehydropantoate 2-reductase